MNRQYHNPYYRPMNGPQGMPPGGGYGAPPPTRPPGRRNKYIVPITIVASSVAMVLLLVAVYAVTFGSVGNTNYLAPSGNYLARVPVVGEISGYDDPYSSSEDSYHHRWTLDTIDTLISDENNVGLYLYVDTPGGGVYESDELYLKIMDYKELTGRPVYVYMGSMAASGGYYISAPADRIYANRNTWTGSIGVIAGTLFDVSEFLAKHGIKATTVKSGANKGMGDYFEPTTPDQREILQALIDEAYMQFVGIVAEGRGMVVEDVIKISDGRIYSAKQALDIGLIDEIARLEDAEEGMLADLPSDTIIDYPYFEGSAQLFGGLFGESGLGGLLDSINSGGDSELAAMLEILEKASADSNRLPLKYMYVA